MPETTKIPSVSLSYCWKDDKYANEIDNDFKAVGITFIMDKRNAEYRTSLKKFMQRVGKSEYVVTLISDDYLKSLNCMYEVSEVINSNEFENKILPITLPSANKIYKVGDRKEYYDYWKKELIKVDLLLKEQLNADYLEEKRKIEKIILHLEIFFPKLVDLVLDNFSSMKSKGYKPILDIMGINNNNILVQVFAINIIKEKEVRQIELEKVYALYPKNQHILFLKADFALEEKQYKLAKHFYKEVLLVNSEFAEASNNLGLLLVQHFPGEEDAARKYYLDALRIKPYLAATHINLATLLVTHFINEEGAKEKAKEHYEKAMDLNYEYPGTHYNLAILLEQYFKDYIGAEFHYKEEIKINSKFAKAYFNLSRLLTYPLLNKDEARDNYIIATDLDPTLITLEGDRYFNIHR